METGHVSEQETMLLVKEAHDRGVAHIVVTNPMGIFTHLTIPEMQEATREGAYMEFVYNAVMPPKPQLSIEAYADGIRQVGPKYCVLGTDFGGTGRKEFHPEALLNFMQALHKQGISVDDINLMAKTNPARVLELQP
jgi:microsomal dipeptidase-like Zn-dependent dipeptidase